MREEEAEAETGRLEGGRGNGQIKRMKGTAWLDGADEYAGTQAC